MRKTTDLSLLKHEYDIVKNNWKDIYQWKRIKSVGNTEILSDWLIRDFNTIKWEKAGLRENNFKISCHEGYCDHQTTIEQFTEKRFCRALYNRYNKTEHQLLGSILDYEVPLTAPNQIVKVNQGDIDLISIRKNEILFIEAKKSNSDESLLKAILEIFVYVTRLIEFKIINQFKSDFQIDHRIKYIPCILTFNNSKSGQQLYEINKYPKLLELIAHINSTLNKNKISALEFYVVEEHDKVYSIILGTEGVPVAKKGSKIVLKKEVKIMQYFPSYCQNTFQNKLDSTISKTDVEMLLYSYLHYDKLNAIQYTITRITKFLASVEKFNTTYPKNLVSEQHRIMMDKEFPFIQAYLKIAHHFPYRDFLDINLKLLNNQRIKTLVPILTNFKSDEILDKLIESYQNIRIVRTKDYDGAKSEEIDLEDETIIIRALCQYDSPKIVPILKESLLKGQIGETKSIVIKKLLNYITKKEIYEFLPVFNYNVFYVATSSNPKDNADWIKKYLNEI